MIHQLAMRLKELHAVGYVHRDLKPGNVMWLPRENRWTVIDFGCAARHRSAAVRALFYCIYCPAIHLVTVHHGAGTVEEPPACIVDRSGLKRGVLVETTTAANTCSTT